MLTRIVGSVFRTPSGSSRPRTPGGSYRQRTPSGSSRPRTPGGSYRQRTPSGSNQHRNKSRSLSNHQKKRDKSASYTGDSNDPTKVLEVKFPYYLNQKCNPLLCAQNCKDKICEKCNGKHHTHNCAYYITYAQKDCSHCQNLRHTLEECQMKKIFPKPYEKGDYTPNSKN